MLVVSSPTYRLLHPQAVFPFIPHRFPFISGPVLNRAKRNWHTGM